MGAALVVLALGPRPSHAEPASPVPVDATRRIEELERQNAELRERLERIERLLTDHGPAPSAIDVADGSAAERASTRGDPAIVETEDAPGEEGFVTTVDPGLTVRYGSVRAAFQLFGDAGFGYMDPPEESSARAGFALGALDLFSTAQVGDHFQALSEIVLEGNSDENEVNFELERLWGSSA